ncbi:G-patch domain-containing protein [Toxoplasma gondii ARI]|uniref:G-patch domain-containing protein n=1 Tax=Toxoplasma gondii ARI TaxID=1074872 RepID=A0A139XVU4_TOXGO|nr:G-patch domain-containing protein [Toxoplasma gondii ARI]
MLDSLYGDLPPPSKDEGCPPKPTSLLGSLYDDLDDTPDTSSSSSASSSSSSSSALFASSSWTAERLQMLTPAVVRKQTLKSASGLGAASSQAAGQASSSKPPLDVAAVAAAASAAAAAVAAQLKAVKSEAFGDRARSLFGRGDREKAEALGASDEAASAPGVAGGVKRDESEKGESLRALGRLGVETAEGRRGHQGGDKETESSGFVSIGQMKDEYDPGTPNDYSAIYREKIRKQQREELERLRQQELDKQRRDRELPGSGSSLSGVAFGDSPSTPSPPAAPPAPPVLPSYIDPAKKSFAARMMEKMGWKHGEGLGVNKQGITAPLVAKKTAMRSGVIVQGAEVVQAAAQVRAQFNRPPTRVLLLLNMVGRGEVDEDLKEETEEEAAKFGNLLQVKIVEAAEAPDDEAVRIFCEYERKEEATRAFMTMNGRVFGGRTVKGRFYCEERWGKDDLMPNPEEEADKPLD